MARISINKTLYNNVYSQYKPPNKSPTLHSTTQSALTGLSVYRFVFTTKIAFGAALLVCLSLLLQPVTVTYADEIDPETVSNMTTHESEQVDESSDVHTNATEQLSDDIAALPDTVSDNGDDETDLPSAESDTQDLEQVTETPEVAPTLTNLEQADITTSTTKSQTTQETSAVDEDSVASGAVPSEPTTEPQVDAGEQVASTTEQEQELLASSTVISTEQPVVQEADTSGSTSSTSVNDTTASGSNHAASSTSATATSSSSQVIGYSTDQLSDEEDNATNTVGSTTAALVPAPSTAVSSVQTDNVLAFKKNECTEVEDGSFYCQKVSYDTIAEDDLFAAPDATGDMEIYMIQKGQQIKVTDNAVDDASPYYDARSKTVVWHRLIKDRYQIISYDVETGEEEQITDTTVNNMEPTRNGNYTVWQRWVQNNWEIILLDDGVETQITDSVEHDIAPHIRGDLIIWNVRSSDGTQSLMTYDIGSETFNEIKDADGVSVANPRMLVMYEAQYRNGDTVMKGFDLVTGEVVPIERIPRDLPADLPSPEATGEVRALPTNPQSQKELVSDTDLDTDEPEDDVVQYDDGDLVLAASTTASTTPVIEDTDLDLDLRPASSSTATTTDSLVEQAAIPDVVIPEFSQDEVVKQASSTQDS